MLAEAPLGDDGDGASRIKVPPMAAAPAPTPKDTFDHRFLVLMESRAAAQVVESPHFPSLFER